MPCWRWGSSTRLAAGDLRRVCVCRAEIVDSQNKQGQALLHVAIEDGKSDLTKVLVDEGGADVNLRDRSGQTPLHLALGMRDELSIKVLLASAALEENA